MPPTLENKGLTAYNEFIAFDGRIMSLDFPSFRGGFDSHCPLHIKSLSHCVCSGFLVSLTLSSAKATQPLEQRQTAKFLLFSQAEAKAAA